MGCCQASRTGGTTVAPVPSSTYSEKSPASNGSETILTLKQSSVADKPLPLFSRNNESLNVYDNDFEKRYKFSRTLEKSNFSRVMVARMRDATLAEALDLGNDEHKVAVKLLSKGVHEGFSRVLFNNELSVLTKVKEHAKHNNVVRLMDYGEDKSNFYIVTELLEGGDLLSQVAQYAEKDHNINEDMASKWVKSILESVCFLHESGVVHRDIAAEHCIFSSSEIECEECRLVLIDFGAAMELSKDESRTYHTLRGTVHYLSPEMATIALSRSQKSDLSAKYQPFVQPMTNEMLKKTDIWAVGVISFILVLGFAPFRGGKNETVLKSIVNGRYTYDLTADVTSLHVGYRASPSGFKGPLSETDSRALSPEFKDFIAKAMNDDWRTRCSAKELLNHEWIVRKDVALRQKYLMSAIGLQSLKRLNQQNRLKKAVMEALVENMNRDTLSQMKENFMRLDHDNDGYLEAKELSYLLMDLGHTIEDANRLAGEIIKASDTNGDGAIDFADFKRFKYRAMLSNNEVFVRRIFDAFDRDKSGIITVEELSLALHQITVPEHDDFDPYHDEDRPELVKVKSIVSEVIRFEAADKPEESRAIKAKGGITFEMFRKAMMEQFEEREFDAENFLICRQRRYNEVTTGEGIQTIDLKSPRSIALFSPRFFGNSDDDADDEREEDDSVETARVEAGKGEVEDEELKPTMTKSRSSKQLTYILTSPSQSGMGGFPGTTAGDTLTKKPKRKQVKPVVSPATLDKLIDIPFSSSPEPSSTMIEEHPGIEENVNVDISYRTSAAGTGSRLSTRTAPTLADEGTPGPPPMTITVTAPLE